MNKLKEKLRKISVFLFKNSRIKYKKEDASDTGIYMEENFYSSVFDRLLNLLMRSLLTAAVVMGTIDGCMSAFGIDYNARFVVFVLLGINLYLTVIQLNAVLRTGGYAVLLYCTYVFYEKRLMLLRSGINALANLSYELIRTKFMFPSVHGFPEQVYNRDVTIPTVLILFGIFMLIVMWEFCGRSVNLILVSVISFAVIGIGLYFGGTPGKLSLVLLTAAWITAACIKFNGRHYFTFGRRSQTHIYQLGKTNYCFKQIDGAAFAQLAALILVFVVCVGGAADLILSPDTFMKIMPEEPAMKTKADGFVRDSFIQWFSNYKKYEIKSRVSGGQLGQYASVIFDEQPDLEITYVPTTYEREYLRTYIGIDYTNSSWQKHSVLSDINKTNGAADDARDNGRPFSRMHIKNVDLDTSTPFLPYYTDLKSCEDINYGDDVDITMFLPRGSGYDVTYYRDISGLDEDEVYKKYAYITYLEVPPENDKLIKQLCKEHGFEKDDPQLTQKIADMFANEYEYTLEPGLVPWKTDFANYFLFESKKGLCAHFATAGTLIYRSLGIPARYVEGYALDYPLVKDSETVLDAEPVENWYGGERPLTRHPVSVVLTDASAHAWIEIYKDGEGWVPVELTPASPLDMPEERDTGMYEWFVSLFSADDMNDISTDELYASAASTAARIAALGLMLILTLLLAAVVWRMAKVTARHIRRLAVFSKRGEKAVIEIYGCITDIILYLEDRKNLTHKDMRRVLGEYMRSPDIVVDTVEKILYSPEPPNEEECENAFVSLYAVLEKLLKTAPVDKKLHIIFKI